MKERRRLGVLLLCFMFGLARVPSSNGILKISRCNQTKVFQPDQSDSLSRPDLAGQEISYAVVRGSSEYRRCLLLLLLKSLPICHHRWGGRKGRHKLGVSNVPGCLQEAIRGSLMNSSHSAVWKCYAKSKHFNGMRCCFFLL